MPTSNKKSDDSYVKLAKTLNRIPNGFATTKDGTHLKVLQWIFEPDEAELASKLKLIGETAEKISKRLKIPLDEITNKLETMKHKGQIRTFNSDKGKKYGLLPFVVGIYEDQLHRMDEEFAVLMEEYLQKTRGEILFSTAPAIHRVIPINSVIKTELKIHPKDQAELMVRNAKSWGIRECICRKHKELLDEPCKYPTSVCLSFSNEENAFEESNSMKPITLDEALDVLKEAQEAGLVHTSMNITEDNSYICNCCTCCCGVLRSLVEFDQPNAIVNSDYIIAVDSELCTGCGICVDRCQFKVLSIELGISTVNDRCTGCGVCAIKCPEDALQLVTRNSKEVTKSPKSITSWMLKKTIKRRNNIFKVL
ncbi:MAG: hypothetical protein FK734_15555 [Asgard group archaeon]|nr:hypothetical protein [Asgard group archaeon]